MTNPDIRKKVDELKGQIAQEVRDKFATEVSRAFDVLSAVMNDPEAKDADRIKCATEILDRAGFVTENKVNLDSNMIFTFEAFNDNG